MEFLQPTFYSVYSFCENGKNYISLTHKREWGNASQTFRGNVYYDELIEEKASKLIKLFNLSYNINMELGTTQDNKIVLFDLNPRIGASSAIDMNLGVNFPKMGVELCLHNIKPSIDKYKICNKRFIRYFSTIWE